MMNTNFYICPDCGALLETIYDANVIPSCCGMKMDDLRPNTVEASGEKHIPAVTIDGDVVTVNVGSVNHPMESVHHIQWVYLKTEQGGQRKHMKPGQPPKVTFHLVDDKPVAVYAYCNLHGLWKTDLT